MQRFEWDENKRRETLETRGLDFIDATRLFDGRRVVTAPIAYDSEARFVSTARLEDNRAYSVVWAWRGGVRRILSFRRARSGEERAYRLLLG
jgi:uncharacterized DUF497 family protein